MDVFDTPTTMRAWSAERQRAGRRIGFVPTMGALHAGHLSLVEIAAQRSDDVVVSIFVNPLQFDRTADFDAYPRPIDDDVSACEAAGVSAIYAPVARTMYPAGFETHVAPGSLAAVMEGAARPGHFGGVTTVVTKLFGAVRPDVAVFGEKDFQQLVIIRRMTVDLDLGVEIVGAPIVREHDGLAVSSRNVRLDDSQRAAAVCVPRALDAAACAASAGAPVAALVAAASAVVGDEPLARLEYIEVFDPETLGLLHDVGGARSPRIAIAVWFGDVRLIDNRSLT
jgi:pantoate--beta-alanine ligase